MQSVLNILEERISKAMCKVCGKKICAALVKQATDPKFGDYQADGVMALAKKIKTNPGELAKEVVRNLDVSDICEPPEVAGPGFINLRLKSDFIASSLLEINADSENRLGMEKIPKSKTIVVDFSGPNIAKEMHVGHLRSTIIGDCICRLLEFLGHNVIRQNHIGDWGLQMGMVVYAVELRLTVDQSAYIPGEKFRDFDWNSIADLDTLEQCYRETAILAEHDSDISDAVREATARLQQGSSFETECWKHARKVTLQTCFEIYDRLKVKFDKLKEIRGESFYKDMLAGIVEELLKRKIAQKSEGAVCVFPEGFRNKEGQPLPVIIQKSDGAYLYATTDLAAIRYRINELKADTIIYVTDARQKLHFEMLFKVADMAGWLKRNGKKVELSHVMFGSVLGEDGTPLKTRSGENVKLKNLLNEAVERARAVVEGKNPELDEKRKAEISKAVGIGAVKYADYSNNRTSDYVFSFEKMLAMDGNTAPYMQYAYARIKSIERKAQTKDVDVETELKGLDRLNLNEPAELDLAKELIRYGEVIEATVSDYRPNYLTTYLYELAQKFSVFYTNCPVLDAGPDKRPTRLLLCDLTARTIRHGLENLLGINVLEQM
jgi:arginyl-tRNA synthetase